MPRRNWDALVSEWRAWMFDNRGLLAATRRHYEWRVRQAARAIGWANLVHADTATLEAWLATLPRTASTRNTYRAALLSFFTFLEQRRIRRGNPAEFIPNLRVAKTLPRPFDPPELDAYLAAGRRLGSRAAVLAELGVSAGLRISEAAGLTWADVGEMSIRVRGKGAKDRVIDLTRQTAAALVSWRPDCPSPEWVFPGLHGRHAAVETLRKLHHRILKEAGLRSHIRGRDAYHRTRHTFGTDALEASGNLRAVQKLMGHESPETTARYAELRDRDRRRVVDQLTDLRDHRPRPDQETP